METTDIVVVLSLGTLAAVAVFGFLSEKKTIERLNDPDAPKSTLASDADSRGKPADV